MKKLYKNQKVSIYKIEKDLDLGMYTLYRYANHDRKIEKMTAKMVCDLANYLKLEPNDLYKQMKEYLGGKK